MPCCRFDPNRGSEEGADIIRALAGGRKSRAPRAVTQLEISEGGLAGTEASRKVTPAQDDDAKRHLVNIGELSQREKLGNQVTVTGFSQFAIRSDSSCRLKFIQAKSPGRRFLYPRLPTESAEVTAFGPLVTSSPTYRREVART